MAKRHRENCETIGGWADRAFGPASSDARVAARANEEMAELLRAVTADLPPDIYLEEAADVVIVLCRLAHLHGIDLFDLVDEKMAVNRARLWEKDGTGHGYHKRAQAAAS